MVSHPGVEDHEGFVVGVERVRNSPRFRELGAGDTERQRLCTLQLGCSCGWRSPRFHAPSCAEWVPCVVELHDDALEDRLGDYWEREHLARVPTVPGPQDHFAPPPDVLYGARELLCPPPPDTSPDLAQIGKALIAIRAQRDDGS